MMGLFLNVQHHKQFARAQVDVPILFSMKLKESGANLVLKQCLRVVPGKRIVATANWNGVEVIAKVFFQQKRSQKHIKREAQGLTILNRAGIPAPKILLQDQCEHDNTIQVLLLERIFPAENFSDAWQNAQEELPAKAGLLKGVIELIAELHLYQLLQDDIHMNNVLIKDGRFYVIDAGMLKIFKTKIPRKKAIDNLAHFLAQFSFDILKEAEVCFAIYATCRGWKIVPKDLDYLLKRVNVWLKWRYRSFCKKLFRNCTQFKKIDCGHMDIVVQTSYSSEEYVEHFLKYCAGGSELSKQFSAYTVKKKLLNKRAKRFWRRLNKLSLFGASVVEPVAVCLNDYCFKDNVVITEKAQGPDLRDVILAEQDKTRLAAIYNEVLDELEKIDRLGYVVEKIDMAYRVVKDKLVLCDLSLVHRVTLPFLRKRRNRKSLELFRLLIGEV